MTLKTSFYEGASGFDTKMATVATAGAAYVVSNNTALTTALQTAAAAGNKSFTVTLAVVFEPANLRLNGIHQKCFFAGILKQMSTEDIYPHEVSLALNTSDTINTSIDFRFTL